MDGELFPGDLEVHPLAARAPMLSEDELEGLAADIKANGLLHPIVRTVDGRVLVDGRNRYAACRRAGVQPVFSDTVRNEEEARRLIVSANLERRDLTKSQKAMWLAMIYPQPEKLKRAGSSVTEQQNVTKERLSLARTVLRYSDEEAQAVLDGDASLDEAYGRATALERAKRLEAQSLESLRGVAPDLADRVEAKALAIEEARALFEARDNENRQTRQGVYHAWRDYGRVTQAIASTPAVLELPEWLSTQEYDTEFRQFFKGGVPELIESLKKISQAGAAANVLISKLEGRK